MDAFRLLGPKTPKVRLVTFSVQLRVDLLATGSFITALPLSMMNVCADRFALKILPVKLPVRKWPVVLVTLKNRVLNPVVELFITSLRQTFIAACGGHQMIAIAHRHVCKGSKANRTQQPAQCLLGARSGR
jgi:DNA-binding transcriptional LysR family regulator